MVRQYQLLLIDDVDDLGRSGEIVKVKPGYARNFLLPKKRGVVADKNALRMQARLKEERALRAEVDKKEADALSARINGMELIIKVKVDPEGHMYGSVGATDILQLFENEGVTLERRNLLLVHPIKVLGVHPFNLRLKEGVPAAFTLKIESETALPEKPVQQA